MLLPRCAPRPCSYLVDCRCARRRILDCPTLKPARLSDREIIAHDDPIPVSSRFGKVTANPAKCCDTPKRVPPLLRPFKMTMQRGRTSETEKALEASVPPDSPDLFPETSGIIPDRSRKMSLEGVHRAACLESTPGAARLQPRFCRTGMVTSADSRSKRCERADVLPAKPRPADHNLNPEDLPLDAHTCDLAANAIPRRRGHDRSVGPLRGQ